MELSNFFTWTEYCEEQKKLYKKIESLFVGPELVQLRKKGLSTLLHQDLTIYINIEKNILKTETIYIYAMKFASRDVLYEKPKGALCYAIYYQDLQNKDLVNRPTTIKSIEHLQEIVKKLVLEDVPVKK